MTLSQLTNYLEDDWDDNNLTGRSNPEEGYFLHPSDNLISDVEAGDVLKGVYRPEWTTISGSPSATNQQMEIPPGDTTTQIIKTPSEMMVGRWEWDYQNPSTSNTGVYRFHIIAQLETDNPEDGRTYDYYFGSNGDIYFQKIITGSFTNLLGPISQGKDTSVHSHSSTRGSYGGFEVFYDTVSQGTFTDTEVTNTAGIVVVSEWSVQTNIDNLVVQ